MPTVSEVIDKEYRKIENVNRLLSCSARRILFTEEKARIFQFDKFGCMENTGLFL